MSFSNTDSFNLERLAKALERIATADEERNHILAAEMVERRESWARYEQAIAAPDPVWRDLPEPGGFPRAEP